MGSKFKTIHNGIRCEKGSALAFILVMITVLIFVGVTLMFVVFGYYAMSKVYKQSEELYMDTAIAERAVVNKLEERLSEVLEDEGEKIDVFTPDQNYVNSEITDIIWNYYKIEQNKELGVSTKAQLQAKLDQWIVNIQGDTNASLRTDFGKALYDIAFRLKIMSNTGNGVLDGSDYNTVLDKIQEDAQNIPSDNPVLANQGLMKFRVKRASVEKKMFGRMDSSDYALQWLNAICTGGVYTEYLPLVGNLADDSNGDAYNTRVVYNVTTSSDIGFNRSGEATDINKTVELAFDFKSTGFGGAASFLAREANVPTTFSNTKLSKPLITGGDILIKGNGGSVTINGDIYAFGRLPGRNEDDPNSIYNMSMNLVDVLYKDNDDDKWKRNYGGVIVEEDNKTVDINGNVTTRAYLESRGNNTNINVTGNLICDAIYIPEQKNEYLLGSEKLSNINIDIGGNVSTYNDVSVGGVNSTVRIRGNYTGLNYTNITNAIRSPTLILNDRTAKIIVDGNTVIPGYNYAGNVTKTYNGITYALRMGLSAANSENFKVYAYDLKTDPANPDYKRNPIFTDNWIIENVDQSTYTYGSLMSYNGVGDVSTVTDLTLREHFYNYVQKWEKGNRILFNFEPVNEGIVLNKSRSHYAFGVVCAQAYNGTYDLNNPPPGRFYWMTGAQLPSLPKPDSFELMSNAADFNWATMQIDSALDNAEEELAFFKEYTNSDSEEAYQSASKNLNDPMTIKTKYTTFADADTILGSDSSILLDTGSLYCNMTKSETDIYLTSAQSGKSGIVFTKGKVFINPGSSSFTFNGVIVAGKGIEINSTSSVTINYNVQSINDLINSNDEATASKIRKFIAPGNEKLTALDTMEVYKNKNKNVRMINRRLVKQHY